MGATTLYIFIISIADAESVTDACPESWYTVGCTLAAPRDLFGLARIVPVSANLPYCRRSCLCGFHQASSPFPHPYLTGAVVVGFHRGKDQTISVMKSKNAKLTLRENRRHNSNAPLSESGNTRPPSLLGVEIEGIGFGGPATAISAVALALAFPIPLSYHRETRSITTYSLCKH